MPVGWVGHHEWTVAVKLDRLRWRPEEVILLDFGVGTRLGGLRIDGAAQPVDADTVAQAHGFSVADGGALSTGIIALELAYLDDGGSSTLTLRFTSPTFAAGVLPIG